MDFDTTAAKLTGKPDEGGWAQAYDFKPDDAEKIKKRGHLFAIIATEAHEEGVDSVLAGREILARLHEEYFGKLEENPLVRLKSAVASVIGEFLQWEGVQIATIALVEDTLYLVCGGGAEIHILRNDLLTKLLTSNENETKAASGYPGDGDIYLIGTHFFFDRFAEGVLKASLHSKDPRTCVEYLAPSIHAQDLGGNLGLIAVKVSARVDVKETLPQDEQGKFEKGFEKKRLADAPSLMRGVTQPTFGGFGKRIQEAIRGFSERKVYVEKKEDTEGLPGRRRVSASVGLLLLVLLGVSVFFGVRQKARLELRKTYESQLTGAKHKFEEAVSLLSLNPERSRELFLDARGMVLGISDKGVEDPDLKELKKNIEENEGKILGEYKAGVQSFVDLGLLSEGFVGDEMVTSQDTLYILDKKGRKIIKVSIPTKRSEVVAGPAKVEEPQSISAYSERVYVVNSEGVFDIMQETKVIEKEWSGGVLAHSYAGNFYLLERSASAIWRYQGDGREFGTRKNWLSQEALSDLTDAKGWTIDGAIWVLKDSGEVLKFSLGSQQPFELSDRFIKGLKPDALFTSDELGYLYVLDKQGSRVVVFTKEGEYKAQYISQELLNARGFAVSEKEKKIIILIEGKLLSIQIAHL